MYLGEPQHVPVIWSFKVASPKSATLICFSLVICERVFSAIDVQKTFMQLKKNETNEYYLSYYSLIGKRIKDLFPFQIHRVCNLQLLRVDK